MSFLDFLESFEGGWLLSDGFLRIALNDPSFPDMRDWSDVDAWLFVRRTSTRTREEAVWFWSEYQAQKDAG